MFYLTDSTPNVKKKGRPRLLLGTRSNRARELRKTYRERVRLVDYFAVKKPAPVERRRHG